MLIPFCGELRLTSLLDHTLFCSKIRGVGARSLLLFNELVETLELKCLDIFPWAWRPLLLQVNNSIQLVCKV